MSRWKLVLSISPRPSPGVILDRLEIEVLEPDADAAVASAEAAVGLRWPGFRLVKVSSCRVVEHNDELTPRRMT